jgi:hypothetical protein
MLDDLVEKEVVPHGVHLAHNRDEAAKPGVRLLSCGRVESPLVAEHGDLLKKCRVAMLVADVVTFLVLTVEVPDIHRKDRVQKTLANLGRRVLQHAIYLAVIVVP